MKNFLPAITSIVLVLGHTVQMLAQIQPNTGFHFLDLSSSARVLSLGGSNISVSDDDLSLAYHNPALLNIDQHHAVSINHRFNYAKTQSGYLSYARHLSSRKIMWHMGLQYVSHGNFNGFDSWGNKTRPFKGNDYAYIVGVSKQLNERFRMGINTKLIYSRLESFISTGISMDIGGYYEIPAKNIEIGIVLKNIGTPIKTYTDKYFKLPLDVQVAVSKRLKHLPFRYSITYHHLTQWNLRYPAHNNTGVPKPNSNAFSGFGDNLLRHFIFSGEFLLGKKDNLKLRAGYNHFVRKDNTVQPFLSFAGISGGVEFKIRHFAISYGFGFQHLHGSIKQLSIRTNLNWIKSKREQKMKK